jgi:hypothetical protein
MTLLQKIRKTILWAYGSIMVDYYDNKIERFKKKLGVVRSKRDMLFEPHEMNRSNSLWHRTRVDIMDNYYYHKMGKLVNLIHNCRTKRTKRLEIHILNRTRSLWHRMGSDKENYHKEKYEYKSLFK